MQKLKESGIEVIAIADHNTHEWIDTMTEAGDRNGIAVFPGCEITTGSGSDGVHLLIVGDRFVRGRTFDLLLAGTLGFPSGAARFTDDNQPRPSEKNLGQILSDVPETLLVIAPHVFGENGIASKKTLQGLARIDAFNHPRLVAVDPGDCSNPDASSYRGRFQQRALSELPRLESLAFVATSDAYSLGELGQRFTWIRMAEPSLEALRQAFLDHNARIICDWDSRLNAYPDKDPNRVRHAWLRSVQLTGKLGNSTEQIRVTFHPCLNVIIGSRGSGKSTIVAAIRRLYAGYAGLPERIKNDAEEFEKDVFSEATILGQHSLSNSQEKKTAAWSSETGSVTFTDDKTPIPVTFPIRVINQKELFERVSQRKDDMFSASRSLLAFVDQALGIQRTDPPEPESWWRKFEDARSKWSTKVQELQGLEADLAQIPSLEARIKELEGQIAAFDAPEAKELLVRVEARKKEEAILTALEAGFAQWLKALDESGWTSESTESDEELVEGSPGTAQQNTDAREAESQTPNAVLPSDEEFLLLHKVLSTLGQDLEKRVSAIVAEGDTALERWRKQRDSSQWAEHCRQAESDFQAYVQSLRAKGLDPGAYSQLRAELADRNLLLARLEEKIPHATGARGGVSTAWDDLVSVLEERRKRRTGLLEDIESRSRLKFEVNPYGDSVGWVERVRELTGVRADAYLGEFPQLSNWLWGASPQTEQYKRWAMWREAVVTSNFDKIQIETNLRQAFTDRIADLDATIRLRLATEVADDVLVMKFLKEGGSSETDADWQPVTQGSPGQRTAAMLAFVLHHGVEPLVLDQPEDDLDTELISELVVKELRNSRWKRQLIVVTHNANIPVNGDAEEVIVMENVDGALRIRKSTEVLPDNSTRETLHAGPIECRQIREDIQQIMEGGVEAFKLRELKYRCST
jgi:ABC-type cobalamin/Fe3+-siderophores transport system ATPase subunit